MQEYPVPEYPSRQEQSYFPTTSRQSAFLSHLCRFNEHSLMSDGKENKNEGYPHEHGMYTLRLHPFQEKMPCGSQNIIRSIDTW